jgi:L-threonylcarbamoyladenylate synthase
MTKIIKPSSKAITYATSVLLNDGIVIIPTMRWYMICCKSENQECIKRIFEAKKRPLSKQPLFILPEKASANFYFHIENSTQQLINKLWPGEITLLLSWADQNIASQFKMYDQQATLVSNPSGLFGKIAKAISIPLAATTVNISNTFEKNDLGPAISLKEIIHFIRETGMKIDLIIDGGICPAFIQTTIVDCQYPNTNPKIIREGFVHERAINLALNINN